MKTTELITELKRMFPDMEAGKIAAFANGCGYIPPKQEERLMSTNTQTDTPETDAVEQHVQRDINRKWVLSDFCKRKERERDAALRELAEMRKDRERLDWLQKYWQKAGIIGGAALIRDEIDTARGLLK